MELGYAQYTALFPIEATQEKDLVPRYEFDTLIALLIFALGRS